MPRSRKKPTPTPLTPHDEDFKLHWFWRVVLLVVGIGLLAAAAYSWYWPPEKTTFAPQATTVTDATVEVSDRSETAVILLIGLSVVAVVLAANGRKLASAKLGGQELTFREALQKVTEDKTKEKAAAASLDEPSTRAAVQNAVDEAISKVESGNLDNLNIDVIAEAAVAEIRPPGLSR